MVATLLFSFNFSAIADQTNGAVGDETLDIESTAERLGRQVQNIHSSTTPASSARPARSPFSYIWAPVSEFTGCGANLNDATSWNCTAHPDSCEAGSGSRMAGVGDSILIGATRGPQKPVEGVTLQGTRIDNETGARTDLGIRCSRPGSPEAAAAAAAPPIVITMTVSDFARLPVEPLQPHAGPADGWLPVNMVNVLHTEPSDQELSTELLGTPVAVRATPVSYHWDLGDRNTITTTNPGKPFPAETVSATYTQEGWYDITLTTTFAGQFSVDGGPWQDIDGTIEVASDPVPLYSKSLESRLVNGDVPVDEGEDPWIPERSPDTEGPDDPGAHHRTI